MFETLKRRLFAPVETRSTVDAASDFEAILTGKTYTTGYITKENALISLEGIAPKNNTNFQDNSDKMISNIKNIVSTYFQISVDDLVSNSRKPILVYARNLCYYIIRKRLDTPYKKIGESFGGKDYTSIMHGYEKINSVIDKDSKIKSDVSYIEDKLN